MNEVVNLADRQPKWRSVTELVAEGVYVVSRTDERDVGPIGMVDIVLHEGVLGTFEVDEDGEDDPEVAHEPVDLSDQGEFEPITSFDEECRFYGPLPPLTVDA